MGATREGCGTAVGRGAHEQHEQTTYAKAGTAAREARAGAGAEPVVASTSTRVASVGLAALASVALSFVLAAFAAAVRWFFGLRPPGMSKRIVTGSPAVPLMQ